MELIVCSEALGQDPTHSSVRGVHLQHKLQLAVQLREEVSDVSAA